MRMPSDDVERILRQHDRLEPPAANTAWELQVIGAGDRLKQPDLILGGDDPMGAIPQTGLTVLFGPSGTGKTWAAVDMSLSAATGREWGGLYQCLRTRTLYLSTEAPAVTDRRVRDWVEHYGFDLGNLMAEGWLHFSAGQLARRQAHESQSMQLDLDSPEAVAAVVGYVEANEIGLVVLDTLSTARTGEEDDNTETNRMLREIKPLWQGRALLLVHHPTKGDPRNMRGAGSIFNAADQVLLIRPREPQESITMAEQKKRGGIPWGHEHEWQITRTPLGHVVLQHRSEWGGQPWK